MYIQKRYRLDAPVERVWEVLGDLQALATCIPGCERCEKLDEATYSATVKARVAYISAEFKGRLTLARVEPPHLMEVSISGQDSKLASMMKATGRLEIQALSPTETEITCSLDAGVSGRLATFGASVIRGKVEETLDQTVENARRRFLVGP